MASYSEEQWAIQLKATSTEMQNNFGKYLDMVSKGKVIIVTKNGKEIGRFVPLDYQRQFMSDRLRGIMKGDFDYETLREQEMAKKYGIDD